MIECLRFRIVGAVSAIVLLAGAGEVHAAGVSCSGLPAPGVVTARPLVCSVDCTVGGTLREAIALRPRTTARISIGIKGTCVESNDHVPGGIIFVGGTLQAPSDTTDPVLGISGSGVQINNVVISGGRTALRIRTGAAVTANAVRIENAANAGVVISHGSLALNFSTVEGSASDGVDVEWGGAVFLNHATVRNNGRNGVSVVDGGTALVEGGATIESNTGNGVLLSQGGFLKVGDSSIIRGNAGNGIYVESGNVAVGDADGPALVENNKGDGLFMRTNSVASFGNVDTKITGNSGHGILCARIPANPLLFNPIGAVSGNGKAPQVSCNISP